MSAKQCLRFGQKRPKAKRTGKNDHREGLGNHDTDIEMKKPLRSLVSPPMYRGNLAARSRARSIQYGKAMILYTHTLRD